MFRNVVEVVVDIIRIGRMFGIIDDTADVGISLVDDLSGGDVGWLFVQALAWRYKNTGERETKREREVVR